MEPAKGDDVAWEGRGADAFGGKKVVGILACEGAKWLDLCSAMEVCKSGQRQRRRIGQGDKGPEWDKTDPDALMSCSLWRNSRGEPPCKADVDDAFWRIGASTKRRNSNCSSLQLEPRGEIHLRTHHLLNARYSVLMNQNRKLSPNLNPP